jgi:hypothetical protein
MQSTAVPGSRIPYNTVMICNPHKIQIGL